MVFFVVAVVGFLVVAENENEFSRNLFSDDDGDHGGDEVRELAGGGGGGGRRYRHIKISSFHQWLWSNLDHFCFSYQVNKTFRYSKYRLKNSLDMYLSNKKNCVEKSSFFIEIWFFTWRVMDENTDPLWFKPKERPKTMSQEKNSNFCYRHSFFIKFFVWKMTITERYCEQNFVSGVARRSGTRCKMKWQLYIWQCCFASRTWTLRSIRYEILPTIFSCDANFSNKSNFSKKECL